VKSIKVAVEQIVHPVQARERLKDVFREELWGHLEAHCEEELRCGRNEEEALQSALERLGDARYLRQSFMDSLSPMDRFEAWVLHHIAPKAGNGPIRHNFRLAVCFFGPAWLGLVVLLVATYPLPGMNFGSYVITIATFFLMLFVLTTHAGLVSTEIARTRLPRRMDPTLGRPFAIGMIVTIAATLLMIVVGHLLVSWLLGLKGEQELIHAYRVFCGYVLTPLCVSLSALSGAAIWYGRHQHSLSDWPYVSPRTPL